MKIFPVVLITLLTTCIVYAQHPVWLDEAIRVDKPDELAYWMAVETDCTLTEDEVERVIEGVLIRNRLEPVADRIFEDGRIYLNVSLRCTKIVEKDERVFSINIHFGRYKPWPAVLFDVPYAAVGIGDKQSMKRICEEHVEAAVAAFIKANAVNVGKR